ncbi:OLC1v1037960C1 [Oldenlandia corymbosa var. corymbosa]|uniref:OLC1v1037960C1 n=1 Tax=Oldenlandia corymbosa var. corymbosa TaxID=529605 RepID=A0AAV1D1U5_OLDCO|nr:OLC1v1037960C1 [Oldenlandia corymbosa var. corymbosa]
MGKNIMSSPALSTLLLLLLSSSAAATTTTKSPRDLVHSSCAHASYPDICLRTLSSYSKPTTSLRELAQAAVRVSISRSNKAAGFLAQLKGNGKREEGALGDCVHQMSDSIYELGKTLSELQNLRRGNDFKWHMSNAETWVSAALTYEDTCLDGFTEIDGKVRSDVKRAITDVAKVTSNALYLITRLDQTRG